LIGKNIYLASDFHLGLDTADSDSFSREKKLIQWLESIEDDCAELFLVGDLFDYWFEYSEVVPKKFMRFLGKLCFLSDKGIKIHMFTGNHDMWLFNYFQEEIGVTLYTQGITKDIFGKKYYIAHGDGLGPGDHTYKIIKAIFSNQLLQWCFHRLHPNFGIKLMKYISRRGRENDKPIHAITEPNKEWLVLFAQEYLRNNSCDYFIFGHRHFPFEYNVSSQAKLFYMGDWIKYNTYIKIDNNGPKLLKYK
jgi:UDP-2,3-diacylglucosamine hydrolase